MFAPNIGVNEDVINGNSSGCLGAYFLSVQKSDHLSLRICQGQKFDREGEVRVNVKKVNNHIETTIGGTAKIESEMLISLD